MKMTLNLITGEFTWFKEGIDWTLPNCVEVASNVLRSTTPRLSASGDCWPVWFQWPDGPEPTLIEVPEHLREEAIAHQVVNRLTRIERKAPYFSRGSINS